MYNKRQILKILNIRILARHLWVFFSETTHWSNTKTYLKVWYFLYTKKILHLDNPKTFNEKIQYLKLHVNITPECTQMVDKYGVREYIQNKIGEQYLIHLFGVWERFEEIDFSKLPMKFVLKTTHDSGGVVICKNKNLFDYNAARKKLNAHLSRNYYWNGREMPYKNVKPRIIAEEYLVDESGTELKDYKFYCFDGKPKILFLASDRFNKEGKPTKFTYYDMELNILQMKSKGHEKNPNPLIVPNWNKMKELAAILSKGRPFLRVDFYNVNGRIYFGELTFHDGSGVDSYEPKECDRKLGELIDLKKYK